MISKEFMDRLEYIGVVLDCEEWHTWGTSVVQGDDGLFHLYACQFPVNHDLRRWGFWKWDEESVVNYYTAPGPEGPYTFVKTIVSARPGGDRDGVWNRYSAHNPEVKRIDDYYVLTYISHPRLDASGECKIGMKYARSPEGPWEDYGDDGLLMKPSEIEGFPTYGQNGVGNPSFVKYKDKYCLFYLYEPDCEAVTALGVAVSGSLLGQYTEQKSPVLLPGAGKKLEDVCVFLNEGSLSAVLCDNFGIAAPNGGLYCELDETEFETTGTITMEIKSIAWKRRDLMFPEEDFSQGTLVYAGNKFERPKIVTVDDQPTYLFMPSGFNEKGNPRTTLHGFRIKK